MSEEMIKQNVTLSIELKDLINSYSPKEFIQEAVMEAIAKNPKIIAEVIQTYILSDILKSEQYGKIREAVTIKLATFGADSLDSDYTFKSALQKAVSEAVESAKPKINAVVSNKINQDGFKQTVGTHISQVVERRVMSALGFAEDQIPF